MKVEKKSGWDFKRNMISLMVATAMAFSWGAVSHVGGFLHQHSRSISSSTAKRSKKSEFSPDEMTAETGTIKLQAQPKVQSIPTPAPVLATAPQ